MKAVILAAGKGDNLKPFTDTRPNPMISVAGKYLFDHSLDLLQKAGINDIFVVVGHQKDKLIEQVGEHVHNGINLQYVEQKRAGGIGDAVLKIKDKILPGEYFLLIYGDIVTAENIFTKTQQSFHAFKGPVASICLPPSNEMFGNVFLNANMNITKIIEKPKGDNLGNYVLSGVYILPESFFGLLEKNGRSMEKAIKALVSEEGLRASMWEDEWMDVVYPWEILRANKIIMDSWEHSKISKTVTLEANVTISGTVHIEDDVIIKAGAVLEGPCSIGKGCYIGNNSLLRSYTALGDNCSVGYGVELKNCVVQKNSHIGRLSFIGDSVLGENVDIGAGSMTVNRQLDWSTIKVKHQKKVKDTGILKLGAFIGDDVVIGAGNTIEPGTIVPPGKVLPAHYSVSNKYKVNFMCGITGAVGLKDISNVLFDGIRNLEYRGYDSCGVALMNGKGIVVKKNIGGVGDVYQKENILRHTSHLGIAHTRWATHGQVTRNNTHPFLSCDNNFAVIHNGIISNHLELKSRLQKEGHKFVSETDTEVIPHLLENAYKKTGNVEASLLQTISQLEGTFAMAFISSYEPDQLYCAKRESPLLLGIGDEVKFIGSDFNAFIDHTKNAVILDDDEYAIVSKDGYIVKNFVTKEEVDKPITQIEWDSETSKKGGYPHYMLKEIYEQPQTVLNSMEVEERTIDRLVSMIHKSKSTQLVGVGTTYYVTMYANYIFSSLAGRYIPAISSDEFVSLSPADKDSFVLAASQSGETYDTLSALKHAKSRGAKTGAIVNVMGSTLSRMVDCPVLQGSGPEICVISTKAALAQMILLTRTALKLGVKNKKLTQKKYDGYMKSLRALPSIIEGILNERSGFIHRIAHKHRNVKNWLYLGRGVYYPIALESALKMKEVAYVHAEGMPCGFLKHGTLAMIDSDINSIVFVPPSSEKVLYESTLASVAEIRARDGYVLGIHFEERNRSQGLYSEELILPPVPPVIAPLIQMVIAQLFAYFTATSLKRNVDKPRSLAKSVTVG